MDDDDLDVWIAVTEDRILLESLLVLGDDGNGRVEGREQGGDNTGSVHHHGGIVRAPRPGPGGGDGVRGRGGGGGSDPIVITVYERPRPA
jgi:hypothetical protein